MPDPQPDVVAGAAFGTFVDQLDQQLGDSGRVHPLGEHLRWRAVASSSPYPKNERCMCESVAPMQRLFTRMPWDRNDLAHPA